MATKGQKAADQRNAEWFRSTKVSSNGSAPPTPKAPTEPTIVKALQDIFFNGTNCHAIARPDGEGYKYNPVDRNPTNEEIEKHLTGEMCLGSYTLRTDSMVNWMCEDVDAAGKPLEAKNIASDLSERLGDIPHAIEYSGGKGYHLWMFFKEPVEAARVKAFGEKLRDAVGAAKSGNPHVEVYPKQEKRTDSTPYGNLVKMPLGLHPKTGNRSIFVNREQWEENPLDPIPLLLQRVNFDAIENSLDDMNPIQRLTRLLKPYWVDQQRHDLALYLCGTLCTLGWSKEDTDALVTALTSEAGGDLANLLECSQTTFGKAAEGKPIQGFSGLAEKLPGHTLRAVMDVAGSNTSDSIVTTLDRLRLPKGPEFLKVRSVTNTALAYLRECGRFIMTARNKKYWFEHEERTLYDCDASEWNNVLYRMGMNLKDPFYSKVVYGLQQEIEQSAERGTVYHKSHWDGSSLWVNFGGQEVYRLNGDEPSLTYNGENNILFDTAHHITDFDGVNLLEADQVLPWDYLTKTISFEKREGVTQADTNQQEHMLRAFVLSVLFQELHPTKPLSVFLGPRGSGKTTTTRNILRFFYGMGEDVLSITDDKQDSIRPILENDIIVALDNLESTKARWLVDILPKMATGGQITLRRYHTTNDRYTFTFKPFTMISAIRMPDIFTNGEDGAMSSRLLPFQVQGLTAVKPENYMQQVLADNLMGMWAGMLNTLNLSVASLLTYTSARSKAEDIRLGDYANFCFRLQDLPREILDYQLIKAGIANLTSKQAEAMNSSSPLLQALNTWQENRLLASDDADLTQWKTASEWNNVLRPIAKQIGLEAQWRWEDGRSLSKHIVLMQGILERKYGFELREVDSGEGKGKKRKEFKVKRVAVEG